MFSFESGGFCNLEFLYGGLGIGKLLFLIKKNHIYFSSKFFHQPWIRIGSGSGWGIQPKMLDPDQMNVDPQPWPQQRSFIKRFI
jgi:hypothetical protein